ALAGSASQSSFTRLAVRRTEAHRVARTAGSTGVIRTRTVSIKRWLMSAFPADLGWRMPAEWEPHEATWIAWPHQRDDWPGKFEPIPFVYAEIVRHLHQSEAVHILVGGRRGQQRARAVLEQTPLDWTRIEFHDIPTDRV